MVQSFKDRFNEAFRFSGFSQVQLAEQLGISKALLNQYLLGSSTPKDIQRIVKLAKLLDVNPAWLAGYDVPKANINITKQEEELLAVYCKLNSLGKSRVDEYALDLTENEKYTKSDTEEGIKIA